MSRFVPTLRTAGFVFLAGFFVHNADHARRGVDASPEPVVWAGTSVAILSAVVLTLVFTRHPSAPFAATVSGFAIAIGVSATHLLPDWGVLSDSLPDGTVDGVTWVAVLAEVGGAVVLGLAGVRIVRAEGFATRTSNAWR